MKQALTKQSKRCSNTFLLALKYNQVSFHISNANSTQSSTLAQSNEKSECPYHKKDSANVNTQTCKSLDEMPGPKRWPIIGNLADLVKNVKTNAGPYFLSLSEQYGDLVRLKTFNNNMVILSNPELMGELYKKEEKRSTIQSSRKYKMERGIPLAPIEMLYEEPWQETRQLFNIAMKPEFQEDVIIPQLTRLNGEMVRRLIKYLETTQYPDKFRLTDSVNAISRYGFDAVMAVFLGVKMTDEITKTFPFEIADFVKYSVESLDIIIRLLTKPSLYQYFKTKEYRRMEYTYDKSFEYANYVMNRFKVNPSDQPRLYELLMERSKNDPNPELLVQSVMNSFLQAAIDITMTMMSHVMYRLAHHPDYQDKLFNELLQVFGEPNLEEVTSENGLSVTFEQFKKLKLTKNFVEEVLRLNPFGFASSARILNQDTELGGYSIPKGTTVIALQRRACLSEEFVPKAKEFIPERHEKNSPLSMKSSFVSSPFGVGARKCPGSRIATLELCMSIISTVRHFKLSLEESEFPEMSTDRSLLYIDMKKHPLYFTPRPHLHDYLLEHHQP